MSVQKKSAGSTVALAAAALLISGMAVTAVPSTAQAGAGGVKCMGANACKGQGKCQTASNACAGQNACKGQGWVKVDNAKACADKGGKVIK